MTLQALRAPSFTDSTETPVPVGGAAAPLCGLGFPPASQPRGKFGFQGPPALAICPLLNQHLCLGLVLWGREGRWELGGSGP